MYHTISEFAAEWRTESAATGRLMDVLTDESLQQAIAPGYRTLGQIAWHIPWVISSISKEGYLEFDKIDGPELAPSSATKIASEYKRLAEAVLHAVETQWTDADLKTTQGEHGMQLTNGDWLHMLVQHEVHHRGQMTVLMRQAGLRPIGVCGPTLDDWVDNGQKPYI